MKKIIVLVSFVFASVQLHAQESMNDGLGTLSENEVKWNVLNTIVQQSIELGYERYVDYNQSVGAELMINDRFSYYPESKKENEVKDFKSTSLAVNYSFYFGEYKNEHASGYFVRPFVKYRMGSYDKDVMIAENQYVRENMSINSLILGLGTGFKIVRNDAFVVAPFVNIGTNFNDNVSQEFMPIEINAGINLGYRF